MHNTRTGMLRAVIAVAVRELRIFFRYPSWYIAMLIWPSLFPMLYIFTSRALAGPGGEGLEAWVAYAGSSNYVAHILTGTILWMWLNMMLWSFGTTLRTEQQRGTLEVNWLAPLPKWFLLAGNSLADIARWLVFLVVAGAEFYFFFGLRNSGSPWLLLLIVLLSIPSIYGLGFVFASLVLWAKETNTAVFVVRGLMMIFCGMTYPIAVLPRWMQSVAGFLPLTHSIEATRAVVSGLGF